MSSDPTNLEFTEAGLSAGVAPMNSATRVEVIRLSMRCFVYGLLSLIPSFCIVTTWLAMRNQRRVAKYTGEQWHFRPLYLLWTGGILLTVVPVAVFPWISVLGAVVLICAHFTILFIQYVHNPPGQWNPARHLAYLGVAFAFAGYLSLIAAAGIVFHIMKRQLLGDLMDY